MKKRWDMSDARQELGRWGEERAAQHLESIGYKILERNWRCRRGEIDLIAQTDDMLVFVEVKTRRGRDFGMPEEAITRKKVKRLLELGQYYLLEKDREDVDWRVDMVAVELDRAGNLLRCEHVPDIAWLW
jgi:putative endonuclease